MRAKHNLSLCMQVWAPEVVGEFVQVKFMQLDHEDGQYVWRGCKIYHSVELEGWDEPRVNIQVLNSLSQENWSEDTTSPVQEDDLCSFLPSDSVFVDALLKLSSSWWWSAACIKTRPFHQSHVSVRVAPGHFPFLRYNPSGVNTCVWACFSHHSCAHNPSSNSAAGGEDALQQVFVPSFMMRFWICIIPPLDHRSCCQFLNTLRVQGCQLVAAAAAARRSSDF